MGSLDASWIYDDDSDVVDDEGVSAEECDDDAWDVCAVPKLFTTEGTRRLFKVQKTLRVGGNHRPTFEYFGYVVEVPTQRGPTSQLEGLDVITEDSEGVVERDLTLSLRYEPPSPKFKQQCPLFASYRLKLSRGSEFIYSTRGMEKTLTCNQKSLVAVWGSLEIAFLQQSDLNLFISSLKYVEVSNELQPLEPSRPLMKEQSSGTAANDSVIATPQPASSTNAGKCPFCAVYSYVPDWKTLSSAVVVLGVCYIASRSLLFRR